MNWITILGSGVLAAIISALVTKAIAERKIYVENITKERAKWRERIRRIAQEYPMAKEEKKIALSIELFSRLNPYDPEDLKLFEVLKNSDNGSHQELSVRVALLLKHDWERAKNEATSILHRRFYPVSRLSYVHYMACNKHYKDGKEDEFIKEIRRVTDDKPCM